MPSVLTLKTFLLREEGAGGLIREGRGGLLKFSTSRSRWGGGVIERRCLLELLRYRAPHSV